MVMTNVAVAVPLEFVALMVTLYVPAEPAGGVPEITPAFAPFLLSVKPGGNPLAP